MARAAKLEDIAAQGISDADLLPYRETRPDLGERVALDIVHDDEEVPFAFYDAAHPRDGDSRLCEYLVHCIGFRGIRSIYLMVLGYFRYRERGELQDIIWEYRCLVCKVENLLVA